LLSGLWHGACFTFVIWGTMHGLMLILEKRISFRIKPYVSIPLVFIVTSFFWLPFRAKDFGHFQSLIYSLTHFSGSWTNFSQSILSVHSFTKTMVLILTFAIFLFIELRMQLLDFNEWITGKKKLLRFVIYYWVVLCILILGNFDIKPYFIYFQF
jgi:alginate O-acetyltransferase complex protein AlgI